MKILSWNVNGVRARIAQGFGKAIEEMNPDIKIFGVEPSPSPLINDKKAGPHKIQGIGANFIPKNYDSNVVDEVLMISDEEAFDMVRELGQKEGLQAPLPV